MCGLAVVYAPSCGGDLRHHAMKNMLEAMAHRGPDGQGEFVSRHGVHFGHVRLAIQDPQHGAQPVTSGRGDCLVFNGEVYNFPELRAELEQEGESFAETGDTEVVARALQHWGESAVDRFNGDFAIVWAPGDDSSMTLIRDRFGVKPLYYWSDDTTRTFVAASEPKAIIVALEQLVPGYRPRVSRDGFLDTSLYGAPVAPFSLFEDIRAVRPGHLIRVDFSGSLSLTETQYWELTVTDVVGDVKVAIDGVRTDLSDATRLRSRSDVGLSTMLSGGLDSSVLAYLAADIDDKHAGPSRHRRAYTIGDPHRTEDRENTFVSGSDLAYARVVAEESGHELIEHTDMVSDPVAFIRRCARSRGSIVSLGSEIAMAKLFELIGKHDRVLISGDGADEVFLGYFMQTDASGTVNQYYSSKNSRYLPLMYRKSFMSAREAWARSTREFNRRLGDVAPSIRSSNHNLIHYLQLRFTLPYLLDRADTLSMAESIELRVPYLDHRLVSAVFNTDKSIRFSDNEKELLRAAFRDRYNPQVIDRKKSVFPYGESREYMEALRREVKRIVSDPTSVVSEVYNVRLLRLPFHSRRTFTLFEKAVGQFYLHAFVCQIISLDELGREHGLTV
jgi:asparagine synthase (glutamine-hydrolysing)|nr:asparagine synthase (glutamine-hydrolyzing) [uncultured Rhodococcus sp.]